MLFALLLFVSLDFPPRFANSVKTQAPLLNDLLYFTQNQPKIVFSSIKAATQKTLNLSPRNYFCSYL